MWMRVIVLLAMLLFGLIGTAAAQKRVALVIGNSAYTAVSALPNPKNDAAAVADLLRKIGFDSVELAIDQKGEAMRAQLSAFAQKSTTADVALVYYAGHGIEVGGVNYLLPVDANNLTTTTIGLQAVALDTVMNAIADAQRLKLVILDACRDNPFAAMLKRSGGGNRSVGQGLARLEPASPETLVAYAAREGTVAQDGDGQHSPYTEALLRHLGEPDVDIRLVFGRIRDDVLQKTNKRQEPFVYGSLGGQVTALAGERTRASAKPAADAQSASGGNKERSSNPQVAAVQPGTRIAIPDADVRRINAFAEQHQIPVPPLDITAAPPTRGLPASAWLGVWGSESGWGSGGREIMVSFNKVEGDGTVSGTYAYGPPGRTSWSKFGPGKLAFSGKPDGSKIVVKPSDTYTFEMARDGTIKGSVVIQGGNATSTISLKPLWRAPKS